MSANKIISYAQAPGLIFVLLFSVIAYSCTTQRTPEQDSRLHFQKGVEYFGEHNMNEALEEFKFALRLDPNFEEPYYYLGVTYQEIGGTEQALEYFNDYLKFKPEHLDTHLRLMRIFYLTGRITEAIAKGDYLLAKMPGKAEIHNLLGDIYLYKKQDAAAAIFHFKQVLKKEPDSAETYMKLAEANLLKKDREQARDLLIKVITLDQSNSKAYNLLAELYTQTHKDTELIDLYDKFSKLSPNDLFPKINLASLYYKQHMYPEAQAVAQEILKLDPTEPTAHFILGQIYLQTEHYPQAVEELLKARVSKHELDQTLFSLGDAYMKLMRWNEAIEAFESLVFIRPERFEPQFYLAKLYLRTKQWEKAAQKANEIINRFYGFEEAYFLQGFSHMQTGEWESAQEDFQYFFSPESKLDEAGKQFYLKIYPHLLVPQRFKTVNPWYKVMGHYLTGIYHLSQSDYKLALSEFDKAIAVGSPFADPYFAKGIVYHMQGDFGLAISSCEAGAELAKGDQALANLLLANIYTSQGSLVTAQDYMHRAAGAVAEFSFSQVDITKNVCERVPLSLAKLNLAIMYLLYGWDDAARAQCQHVLKANPYNPLAKYIIDEMYLLTTKYYDNSNRFDDVIDKLLKYP
jgi:tetratricopeptide (TPR) repeat protein